MLLSSGPVGVWGKASWGVGAVWDVSKWQPDGAIPPSPVRGSDGEGEVSPCANPVIFDGICADFRWHLAQSLNCSRTLLGQS